MALLDRHARINDEIPSSSMADIAFLLLVFFLVTTVFPKDQGLALVLPAEDTPAPVSPKNVLRFAVAQDGALTIQLGSSSRAQIVRHQDVPRVWREHVEKNPDLIAAVETHPDAAYAHMVDVLDGLQLAGAKRIALKRSDRPS